MGLFRSGTTLISKALALHPHITIGWQPYFLFFKECRNKFYREILKEPLDGNYPMGILQFGDQEKRDKFKDVFNLLNFNEDEINLLIDGIKKQLTDSPESINQDLKPSRLADCLDGIKPGSAAEILSQLMAKLYICENSEVCSQKSNNIVGIKECFCEEFIEPLIYCREIKAKIIQIIRDPRAVAASRNYGRYRKATGTRYPLCFIVNSWRRAVAYYVSNKNKKDYLMVKYEDLVKCPQKELEKICNHLFIDYFPEMADFSNIKDAKGNKWEANTSFDAGKHSRVSSVDKWAEVLSSQEVRFIEYHCRKEMNYLGYALTTQVFDKEEIGNYQEDLSVVSAWLKSYMPV